MPSRFSRCFLLLLALNTGCIYAEASLSAPNGPGDSGTLDMGPLVDMMPLEPDLAEPDARPDNRCDSICATNQMCKAGACVCDPDSSGFDLASIRRITSFSSLTDTSPVQVIKHKVSGADSHFAFVTHNKEVVVVGLLARTGELVEKMLFSLDKSELAKSLRTEEDLTIEQVDLVPALNGLTLVVATSSPKNGDTKTLRLIGAKLTPQASTDMQWGGAEVYWEGAIRSDTFVAWDAAGAPGVPEPGQAPFLTFGIFGPNVGNPALVFHQGTGAIADTEAPSFVGFDEKRVESTWFVHGDLSTRKSEENVVQTFVFDSLSPTRDVVAFEITLKLVGDTYSIGEGSVVTYTSNPQRKWLDHGIRNLPATLPLVQFRAQEAKVLGLLRTGAEPSLTIGLQTLTQPEGAAESASSLLPLESYLQPLELLSGSLPERALNASLPYPVAWASRGPTRTSQLRLARVNPLQLTSLDAFLLASDSWNSDEDSWTDVKVFSDFEGSIVFARNAATLYAFPLSAGAYPLCNAPTSP